MAFVVRSYDAWVRRNAFWFMPILDTARSMTVFLPGRFNETELRSESIYTSLNLLGVYHDAVLNRGASGGRTPVAEYKTPNETSSTRFAKNLLTFLMYTEVLSEAVARHLEKSGVWANKPQRKWLVILAVELTKVLCKLRLVRANNGRMLVSPNPEESMFNSAVSEAERKIKDAELTAGTQPHQFRDLKLLYARHGRGLHPHGRFVAPGAHPRDRFDYRPSASEKWAEILFQIRPLVYVVARLLCRADSWTPFIASISVDLIARVLVPKFDTLSPSQQVEVRRRSLLLMLYLIRSPLYETFTIHPLNGITRVLGYVPLVGSIFGQLKAVLETLQGHYFHTSGSS